MDILRFSTFGIPSTHGKIRLVVDYDRHRDSETIYHVPTVQRLARIHVTVKIYCTTMLYRDRFAADAAIFPRLATKDRIGPIIPHSIMY